MASNQIPASLFGLLRHGKTIWNAEKRIQGSRNSELTEEGRADCGRWADFLAGRPPAWDLLISSPLERAVVSAGIISERLALTVIEDDGVREQDWGLWEGLSLPEITTRFPGELERQIALGWDFRPPLGESRREVLARARAALTAHAAARPGANLLVVCHLGVIKTLLHFLEGREFLPAEPVIVYKNRFYTVSCAAGELSVVESSVALPARP